MNPKDLLTMLDLEGKPPDPVTPAEVTSTPVSPTALEVDAWGLRRGRDLLQESERLAKSGTDAWAVADFFTAAFDPDPRLVDQCSDPRRQQFLVQLLDTPDYHALHTATRLDETAASIAATHFAEQFAHLTKEETPPHDPLDAEMATLRAVGRALAEADKELTELRDATSAVGLGPGEPGSHDPRAMARVFQRVRNDPTLRRICELAGRFRRVAFSKQRQKVLHGLDEIVGVEPGGEIARLLPSELAQLMIPELELATLRRIVEHQALCREQQATEPVGRGPIVVCLDESGSMSGEKIQTAKALALALAWIARHQRRWAALIAYSGDSGERLLPLPPGRWNEGALLDWLTAFIGKGSDLDVPVRELPRMVAELQAPAGITDVLIITDAQCRIPAPVITEFLAWKQPSRARVISLVVDHSPGDLVRISDEVHPVTSLAPDSAVVGRVLSL